MRAMICWDGHARNTLDQWAPEQFCGAGGILADEEVSAGGDKLLLGQQTVVVGVAGLEAGGGHVLIEPEDFEEDGELSGINKAIVVGVYGLEEEGKRASHLLLL